MKILALDLGKFKSVACIYRAEDGEHEFRTIKTAYLEVGGLLDSVKPDRFVIEISPLGRLGGRPRPRARVGTTGRQRQRGGLVLAEREAEDGQAGRPETGEALGHESAAAGSFAGGEEPRMASLDSVPPVAGEAANADQEPDSGDFRPNRGRPIGRGQAELDGQGGGPIAREGPSVEQVRSRAALAWRVERGTQPVRECPGGDWPGGGEAGRPGREGQASAAASDDSRGGSATGGNGGSGDR